MYVPGLTTEEAEIVALTAFMDYIMEKENIDEFGAIDVFVERCMKARRQIAETDPSFLPGCSYV